MKRTPFQTEKATCIFDGCPSDDLRLAVETFILPDGCVETVSWFICEDHVASLPTDAPTR